MSKAEIDDLLSKTKTLEKQNQKLKSDIESKMKDIALAEETIRSWTKSIDEREASKRKIQKENDDIKNKLSELEKKNSTLDKQIHQYQVESDDLKKNLFEMKSKDYYPEDGTMPFKVALKILGLDRRCSQDEVNERVNSMTIEYGPVNYNGVNADKILETIALAGKVAMKNIR
jgi:chromosome segregation ATPase